MVLLDPGQMKALRSDADRFKKLIAVVPHPAEEVESQTVPGGKIYYLSATDDGASSYAVLAHLIRSNPQLRFCASWTAVSASAMFSLDVRGSTILMIELIGAPALKRLPMSTSGHVAGTRLGDEAQQALPALTRAFDVQDYSDDYSDRLLEAARAHADKPHIAAVA